MTGRSSFPRERPLRWVGGGGGTEGPATKLIGNLLARPQAAVGGWRGERGFCPGTEKCLQG